MHPLFRNSKRCIFSIWFCFIALIFIGLSPATTALAQSNKKGYLYPADQGEGFYFTHHDWEMACDNTRTCRAAGYHADGQDMTISVLLTRLAGSNTTVKGQVMIGQYGKEPDLSGLPRTFSLALVVDGRQMGKFKMDRQSDVADLPPLLVAALLKVLPRTSSIEFVYGDYRWPLSSQGATATLLKMDAFQGRIDTPSALIKKGRRSEATVRPAVPLPVVIVPPVAQPLPEDASFVSRHANTLMKALQATLKEQDQCPYLSNLDPNSSPQAWAQQLQMRATRLSPHQMLASINCWLAAYNSGSGNWVVNDTPPFQPQLITTNGEEGSPSSSQKGRGLGDCWSYDGWEWDGRAFIHVESSTTGMCRLMALGGAWHLPTIVTDIQHIQPQKTP